MLTTAPDWNQPNNYLPVEPSLNLGDYPSWCSPTAGACLMGYWEDTLGFEHVQNDYVFQIPEPAALALISLGALGLIRKRRT